MPNSTPLPRPTTTPRPAPLPDPISCDWPRRALLADFEDTYRDTPATDVFSQKSTDEAFAILLGEVRDRLQHPHANIVVDERACLSLLHRLKAYFLAADATLLRTLPPDQWELLWAVCEHLDNPTVARTLTRMPK